MSRREIVVLVSRAIAILTLTTALIGLLINLPYQIFLLIYQLNFQGSYIGRLPPVSTIQWLDSSTVTCAWSLCLSLVVCSGDVA